MTTSRLRASLVFLAILSAVAFAGIRGPGKYCGVVVYDRWDSCTLYSGVYLMYISEGVKAKLREHAGKCVRIDAKKVHQPVNPGDGLISDLVLLGPAPPAKDWVSLDGLELRAVPAFANGERPRITIAIRNSADKDVKVFAGQFAPTLLTKKADNKFKFIPSDGPSFAVITRHAFSAGPDNEPRTSGRGIENGQSYAWSIDAPLPDTFILKPREERTVTMSLELPQGEYDFLAGYGGGVHEGKCLATNLVAFDVDHEGKAILVDIKPR